MTIEPTKYGIDFVISRDGNEYRDCLWFTKEEYEALTPEQIQAMQNERFENWLITINTAPTE